MTRVLVDTNVVLDVLADRGPFAEASAAAPSKIESGSVEGYLAAHTITTLHCLLSKHVGKARTRRVLTDLLSLVELVPVDEDRLRHALAANWADFRKSAVKTVTPAELLAVLP